MSNARQESCIIFPDDVPPSGLSQMPSHLSKSSSLFTNSYHKGMFICLTLLTLREMKAVGFLVEASWCETVRFLEFGERELCIAQALRWECCRTKVGIAITLSLAGTLAKKDLTEAGLGWVYGIDRPTTKHIVRALSTKLWFLSTHKTL